MLARAENNMYVQHGWLVLILYYNCNCDCESNRSSPFLEVGLFERSSGLLDNLDVVEVSRPLEAKDSVDSEVGEAVFLVRQQLRAQRRPEMKEKESEEKMEK